MYKALAFKELRENALIGGLICGALFLVVLDQMGVTIWHLVGLERADTSLLRSEKIPFVNQELINSLAIVVAIGAPVIGFRQVLGESIRGTWLFLLHRPAPRGTIVLTKVLVGAGLLIAASLFPLLVLALWAATPGTHASPFEWGMTEPPIRIVVAATPLFLAGWLSALRPARWYGSRLLPLIPAGILFAIVFETAKWPAFGWGATLIADLLYLASIGHVATTREYP